MKKLNLTWKLYGKMCEDLSNKIMYQSEIKLPDNDVCLYGVPRGGVIIANILSYILDVPVVTSVKEAEKLGVHNVIVVDDISDTGKTFYNRVVFWNKHWAGIPLNPIDNRRVISASLILNERSKFIPDFLVYINRGKWVNFPYDREKDTISKVKKRV